MTIIDIMISIPLIVVAVGFFVLLFCSFIHLIEKGVRCKDAAITVIGILMIVLWNVIILSMIAEFIGG